MFKKIKTEDKNIDIIPLGFNSINSEMNRILDEKKGKILSFQEEFNFKKLREIYAYPNKQGVNFFDIYFSPIHSNLISFFSFCKDGYSYPNDNFLSFWTENNNFLNKNFLQKNIYFRDNKNLDGFCSFHDCLLITIFHALIDNKYSRNLEENKSQKQNIYAIGKNESIGNKTLFTFLNQNKTAITDSNFFAEITIDNPAIKNFISKLLTNLYHYKAYNFSSIILAYDYYKGVDCTIGNKCKNIRFLKKNILENILELFTLLYENKNILLQYLKSSNLLKFFPKKDYIIKQKKELLKKTNSLINFTIQQKIITRLICDIEPINKYVKIEGVFYKVITSELERPKRQLRFINLLEESDDILFNTSNDLLSPKFNNISYFNNYTKEIIKLEGYTSIYLCYSDFKKKIINKYEFCKKKHYESLSRDSYWKNIRNLSREDFIKFTKIEKSNKNQKNKENISNQKPKRRGRKINYDKILTGWETIANHYKIDFERENLKKIFNEKNFKSLEITTFLANYIQKQSKNQLSASMDLLYPEQKEVNKDYENKYKNISKLYNKPLRDAYNKLHKKS